MCPWKQKVANGANCSDDNTDSRHGSRSGRPKLPRLHRAVNDAARIFAARDARDPVRPDAVTNTLAVALCLESSTEYHHPPRMRRCAFGISMQQVR